MPIKKTAFIVAFMLVTSILSPLCAQSPGTTSDPLVSKSYLDHFFRFRSLVMPADSSATPMAGAMFIVRSGQIVLTGPTGKAIIDLTSGQEIPVGKELPHNHLLIIPDSADYTLKAKNMSLLLAAFFNEEDSLD
jgi:hypothetical protein